VKIIAVDQNQDKVQLLENQVRTVSPEADIHGFLKEADALSCAKKIFNSSPQIQIKAFGSFDVFVNGEVLPFRRERAKEMFAYLVDRRGSLVTRKELSSTLFEDHDYSRSTQTYITQIIQSLKNTLKEAQIEDCFVVGYNGYAVDVSKISCDSYDYLDGKPEADNYFHGEYMSQYSWGEEQLYQFE